MTTHTPFWTTSGANPTPLETEIRRQAAGKLDTLQQGVNTDLFPLLRKLPRVQEPQELFGDLWQTCEALAKHLCNLGNALYLAAPESHDKSTDSLETVLRQMNRKGSAKLAFGDYVRGLQAMTAWIAGADGLPAASSRLKSVLTAKVPPSCAEYIQMVPMIAEATSECGVPLQRVYLQRYIERRTAHMTAGSKSLTDFLFLVGKFRNDAAHGRAKAVGEQAVMAAGRGVDSNKEWCHVVNRYLAPAIRDLLTSKAMVDVLTNLQVVEVVRSGSPSDREGLPVDWALSAIKPPDVRMTGDADSPQLASGARVLAAVTTTRQEVVFVADWKQFPRSRQTLDKAKAEYKVEFARRLFNDGLIQKHEHEALDAFMTRNDLTDKEVATARGEIWDAYESLCAWADSHATSGAPPSAVPPGLPDELGRERRDPVALLARATTYLRAQETCVLEYLDSAEHGAASTNEIAQETRLHHTLVEQIVQRLLRTRRISATSRSGVWQIHDATAAKRLDAALNALREDLSALHSAGDFEKIPQSVWKLVDVSVSLLTHIAPSAESTRAMASFAENLQSEFGAAETSDEEEGGQSSTIGEADGDEASSAAQRKPRPRPLASLVIDNQEIAARGLTGLMRKLDEAGVWNRACPKLLTLLPRRVGRTCRLAATEPRHRPKEGSDEGTVFGYPVEVKLETGETVYFEANLPREDGIFHIVELLCECGVPAASIAVDEVEQDAPKLSSEANDEAEDSTAEVSTRKLLTVQLEDGASTDDSGDDGSTHEFEARSVRELLGSVVGFLRESRGDEFYAALPKVMGRKRYLVHTAPVHPSGQRFRSGEQVEDVYVETHLSRADALKHLTSLCADLQFDCVTTDDGESDDDNGVDGADDAASHERPADKGPLEYVLPDGGVARGKTVRFFLRAVLDAANAGGHLDDLELPVPLPQTSHRRSHRYLLAADAQHANGKAFGNPMEYVWSGGALQVELNLTRELALKAVSALFEQLDPMFGDLGEFAPVVDSDVALL